MGNPEQDRKSIFEKAGEVMDALRQTEWEKSSEGYSLAHRMDIRPYCSSPEEAVLVAQAAVCVFYHTPYLVRTEDARWSLRCSVYDENAVFVKPDGLFLIVASLPENADMGAFRADASLSVALRKNLPASLAAALQKARADETARWRRSTGGDYYYELDAEYVQGERLFRNQSYPTRINDVMERRHPGEPVENIPCIWSADTRRQYMPLYVQEKFAKTVLGDFLGLDKKVLSLTGGQAR